MYSDAEEPGFAEHVRERRIPVGILPAAQLVRPAAQSIDGEREVSERDTGSHGPERPLDLLLTAQPRRQ